MTLEASSLTPVLSTGTDPQANAGALDFATGLCKYAASACWHSKIASSRGTNIKPICLRFAAITVRQLPCKTNEKVADRARQVKKAMLPVRTKNDCTCALITSYT